MDTETPQPKSRPQALNFTTNKKHPQTTIFVYYQESATGDMGGLIIL
jgi:hypothetical protein